MDFEKHVCAVINILWGLSRFLIWFLYNFKVKIKKNNTEDVLKTKLKQFKH